MHQIRYPPTYSLTDIRGRPLFGRISEHLLIPAERGSDQHSRIKKVVSDRKGVASVQFREHNGVYFVPSNTVPIHRQKYFVKMSTDYDED